MRFCIASSVAMVLFGGSFARAQSTTTIPLTGAYDTFIDSAASISISGGYDTASYGSDIKVKAVNSATRNSFSGVQTISYTHALFQIPPAIISDFSTGLVTDITVNYFPANDSLSNPTLPDGSTNPNYDGNGTLQIHPLTKSFVVGTGKQTPAAASPAGGATWGSTDGMVDSNGTFIHPWATPGGDYDSTYVADNNATLPPSNPSAAAGFTPFTFDITSLFALNPGNSDLETNGGLIRLPLDSVTQSQIDNATQDFTSLYSGDNAAAVQPYFTVTFAAPEPTSLLLFGLVSPLMLCRKRSVCCANG